MFLIPILFVAFYVLIFLLLFLLIAGAVWLIVKFARSTDLTDDNTPAPNFTANTVNPTTNAQSSLSPQSPALIATVDGATTIPPEVVLPQRDYFKISESAISYYWGEAFYKNLESFTGSSITHTDGYHGLIYYYIVDGQVRYIGQTRENTLKWRMNKPQADGRIGYNLYIKRNLLQAAAESRLRIVTRKVLKSQLDQYEKAEIEAYAPTNRLWNQEHNLYFKVENFYK